MNVAEIIAIIQLIEEVGPPLILMLESFVELIKSKNPNQGAAAAGKVLSLAMVEVKAFSKVDFGPVSVEESNQKKFQFAMQKVQEICESINVVVSETDLRSAVQNAYSILKAGKLPDSVEGQASDNQ